MNKLLLATALLGLAAPLAQAADTGSIDIDGKSRTRILRGACNADSITAHGPIGSDLEKVNVRYSCDTATVTLWLDGRVMFQTLDRKVDGAGSIIGFAGPVQPGGVDVNHLYLAGRGQLPAEGKCFTGKKGFACVAKVDQDGQRTVASVNFVFAPGEHL
jgi:hypothetical protein